jgi:hypothetical protein
MKSTRLFLTLLVAVFGSFQPCQGRAFPGMSSETANLQKQLTLDAGDRLRITAPSIAEHRPTGTLAAIGVDTLWLRNPTGRRYAVPLARVTRIEVNPGRRSRAKFGALMGMVIGGTASVLLVDFSEKMSTGSTAQGSGTPGSVKSSRSRSAIAIVGMSTAWSAFVGGIIGSNFEKWKRVPVQTEVSMHPEGAVLISSSYHF